MTSRYFTRRAKAWVAGEDAYPVDIATSIPTVCDHEATDTGLIDASGDAIMRAPNPMGFIWEPLK